MIRDRLRSLGSSLKNRVKRLPRVAWDAHSNRIVLVPAETVKTAPPERLDGHKAAELPETAEIKNSTTRSVSSRSRRT